MSDIGVSEAVGRAHRKFQFIDIAVQIVIEFLLQRLFFKQLLCFSSKLMNSLSCVWRIFARRRLHPQAQCCIGPDFQGQLIIISYLSHAGVGNIVIDLFYRVKIESIGIVPMGWLGCRFFSAVQYPLPRLTLNSILSVASVPSVARCKSGSKFPRCY